MPNGLPPQIEIFRAGRHIDDSGAAHEFSQADVAGMAASYDPTLREAPLTVGHPADNLPAYGWVKGLAVNTDGRLVMDTRDVEPQFSEMVRTRRFPKRSASFYPPQHPNNPKPGQWCLRHVAFLGAQPPAIAGLKDIPSFAEDAAGTVNFSETTQPTQEQLQMTKELEDKLAAAQQQNAELAAKADKATADAAAAAAQLAQFAETARTERTASFTNYAEAQVKAAIVKPSEKGAVVDLLNLAADAKAVSFSEAGAVRTVPVVDFVKSLIERAKPAVSFAEQAAGNAGQAQGGQRTEAELDAAAQTHARTHKVSYAEALSAVTTFTQ